MKILLNNNSLFKSLRPFKDIGFVPTMGSIHRGHLSLINRSNHNNKKTIVSIFINPKQFNSKKDLKTYPSNLKNLNDVIYKHITNSALRVANDSNLSAFSKIGCSAINSFTYYLSLDLDAYNRLNPVEYKDNFQINYQSKNFKGEFRGKFKGIIKNLEKRYSQTQSSYIRDWVEKFMAIQYCNQCEGSRLKATHTSVYINDLNIHEVGNLSIVEAIHFFKI